MSTTSRHNSRFGPLRMEEAPTERARMTWRRILAVVALLFALFMTYRIFGVYTVRSGSCDFDTPPVPLSRRTETTLAGDRKVFYPPRLAATQRDHNLVVLSYNIEGHAAALDARHIADIAAIIRKVRPDVVGLQEIHRNSWQARFEDQAAELARLTGMEARFGRSFAAMGGEYGNLILTRGKILHSKVHDLPSVGEPRSALECTIVLDGRRFTVFSTHLTTWGRFRRGARRNQIDCLVETMRRSPLPYIVVGDFNAPPGTPEIDELLENRELQLCGETSEPTHELTRSHIDYIFADYGWQTVNARVLKIGPSDHWPVMAELRWTAEENR